MNPNNTKVVNVRVPVTVVEVAVTVTETEILVPKTLELRRWKAHEIPIGAYFKGYSSKIQKIERYEPEFGCIKCPAIILSGGESYNDHYFIGDLVTSLLEPKYSWDGVNWERCGTWVEAK